MHTHTEGSTPLPAAVSRRLRAILGDRGMVTERDRLLPYESDALATERGLPRAALFPRSEEEVSAVLEILHGKGIPFVPRGSGTGLSGGAVARDQVLVCTNRMDRILELDPDARRAVVEPGVITADVSEAAAPHGLRYLPDPASATACTMGGNVAENAGGPHCLKHGVTTDHVTGLRLLLPDGRAVDLGRGEDGGLDLAALVVGSEGTLGVVTRIEVRLVPRPEGVRTALGFFDAIGDAGRAVTEILEAGVVPVAMELVDGATLRVVEQSRFAAGLPTDAGAALLVECEGFPEEVRTEMEAVVEVLRACGARSVRTADDEESRTRLWHARKKAYGALGRLAPDIFVQDAAVPRSALPDLLPRIEEIADRHGVRLVNFFHAGDGNVHPNLVFDRRDPEQVERVEAAGAEIMELCVEAGGTITGEHGVGLDKKGYMKLIYGPAEVRAMRRIRRAFDPAGLCNPGKMLPEEDGSRDEGSGTGTGNADGSAAAKVGDEEQPGQPSGGERPDHPAPAIHHHREDLMITVPGETFLAEVVASAGDGGQWLPPAAGGNELTAFGVGELTVDGLVAAAPTGPYDAAYGHLGRHVLELHVEAPDGQRYRWGRKVVKNVAGYDLPRLFCGHRGRLGRVREATLRLWPTPEARRTVRLTPGLRALEALSTVSPRRDVRPDGAVWIPEGEDEGQLLMEIAGPTRGAGERLERLQRWAREEALESEAEDGSLAEVGPHGPPEETGRSAGDGASGPPVLRGFAGNPYLARALRRIREAGEDEPHSAVPFLRAYPGRGVLRMAVGGSGAHTAERAAAVLALLPDARWRLEAGPRSLIRMLRERRHRTAISLEQEIVESLGGEREAEAR